MPKQKSAITKSEEIRQLLRANPKMPVKEVVETLAGKGIKVLPTQVYFVKGKLKGKRGRRKKAREMVEKVATATNHVNPVAVILEVKGWAEGGGGLKKLEGLVDALSE